MRPRTRLSAVAVALVALPLTGCGLGGGLYNVPLPGGADLGAHPFTVTVKFDDVLDLVPQSSVKVNDVAVGRVTGISLETSNGKVADVRVEVNGNVTLPANAIASIDQTSLLGEKYVSLAAPLDDTASGRLADGAVIPVSRTSQGVEVETVLGALSQVLNGGGIGTLNDITQSLNTVFNGHETAARALIDNIRTIVSNLDDHKQSITNALDALATLSTTLRRSNTQITNVITSLAPGLAELARQRSQLITMLRAFDRLSTVTVATLDQSKTEIIGDLNSLAPVLRQLAAAGTALPQSLQVLLTYPFPDSVLNGIVGDYFNAYVTTSLNTPGGTVVTPRNFSTTPAARINGKPVSPPIITPPAGLLPATSAAAPGLPATLSTTTSMTTATTTKGVR